MLWAAWFAEYGVLYTYQIFLPTILSAEGHSIVNSFGYSVVIYSAVIPGYALGGVLVEWLDRKYAILLSFALVAVFGTLFGYSRSPDQIMASCGLTLFFLSPLDPLLSTHTPPSLSHRDSGDSYGYCLCVGTSGCRNDAFIFLAISFAIQGKSLLLLIIDPIRIVAAIVVLCAGPSTRGKPLQEG